MDDLQRDGLPSVGESDPTPTQWMRSCAHYPACKRLAQLIWDVKNMDDGELAEALRCATCEEWTE